MSIGTLAVIYGPTRSGKTQLLIQRIRRVRYARRQVYAFCPTLAGDDAMLTVHGGGQKISCQPAITVRDITAFLEKQSASIVVVIDDAHEYDPRQLFQLIAVLRKRGVDVIVAGRNVNFRIEPYNGIACLAMVADEVILLTGVCVLCNESATTTQRLIDGKPARFTDSEDTIYENETEEPRCLSCHEIMVGNGFE